MIQPRQIVYLENESSRLYAEVIQVVASRQTCWVRPFVLLSCPANFVASEQPPVITDLRSSLDLLLPLKLFHAALDTEVIPLLVGQLTEEIRLERDPIAIKQLNQFIRQVWQSYSRDRPAEFSNTARQNLE